MKFFATLLLLAAAAAADDTAALIDQLFHADAKTRAAAREKILAMDKSVLAPLLDRIESRQKDGERVLQIYAVRDLTGDAAAWSHTRETLRELDAQVRDQENGVLVVVATRKVHAQIAAILAGVRERMAHVITIATSVVELGQGIAAPSGFEKGAFEDWIAAHDVKVERLPRLTCRNGQRVEIASMREVSYVADFDVELAQGAFIADPIIEILPKGLSLNVRAIVGDRIELFIDVHAADVTQPMAEAKLPLPAGQPVRIQTPESRSTRIRTSRSVASGAATVVDLGDGRIVVIEAEATQLEK